MYEKNFKIPRNNRVIISYLWQPQVSFSLFSCTFYQNHLVLRFQVSKVELLTYPIIYLKIRKSFFIFHINPFCTNDVITPKHMSYISITCPMALFEFQDYKSPEYIECSYYAMHTPAACFLLQNGLQNSDAKRPKDCPQVRVSKAKGKQGQFK